MVEKYVPKVGDKVRATRGENVLVGVVRGQGLADEVLIDSDGENRYVRTGAGWRIEQLVSVPTKFGAVIRRADGLLFSFLQENTPRVTDTTPWRSNNRAWASTEHATAGGFSVLFDGVDE